MMRRNTVSLLAPSDSAACSISVSSSSSTGWTARTTNGSVTNSSASTTAAWVKATSTGAGPSGPQRASSVRPATIVGSANGRSISELTIPLPRNSSRTSTHAISVPVTALITTTISDAISVSRSAATAWSLVTAVQNASNPPSIDATTTAASGISATMLRYAMAMPRPSTAPGIGSGLGARPAVASLVGGSALPLGLEDLGDRRRSPGRRTRRSPCPSRRTCRSRTAWPESGSRSRPPLPRPPGGSPCRRRCSGPPRCRGSRRTPARSPGSSVSLTTAIGFSIRIVSSGTT